MTYAVKEIFYTLQGEGANAGRAAVFCRFSGCNLWSGREEDRASAICTFCDTDFVGTDGTDGGKFPAAQDLAGAIASMWPVEADTALGSAHRFVVLTGGEPALQVDEPLLEALHALNFEVAIETNGSLALPRGIDWICVSPKANVPLRVTEGQELKLVYPQMLARPEQFEALSFEHFLLQPMDVSENPELREQNVQRTVKYCLEHPRWRLSTQTHKALGIR